MGQLSSPVLRGERGSDAPDLPGKKSLTKIAKPIEQPDSAPDEQRAPTPRIKWMTCGL